jgi:hypothetical protein
MKHLLGYVIWNKERMLDWLADGILESFTPDQVDILFVIDGAYDGTDVKIFDTIKRKLSDYKCEVKIFKEETWKFPCQNWMMQYCIDNNYKSWILFRLSKYDKFRLERKRSFKITKIKTR